MTAFFAFAVLLPSVLAIPTIPIGEVGELISNVVEQVPGSDSVGLQSSSAVSNLAALHLPSGSPNTADAEALGAILANQAKTITALAKIQNLISSIYNAFVLVLKLFIDNVEVAKNPNIINNLKTMTGTANAAGSVVVGAVDLAGSASQDLGLTKR